MSKEKNEAIWEIQNEAFRDPVEVTGGKLNDSGLVAISLKYKVSKDFIDLIDKEEITLLVSREYEHLVIGLSVKDYRLRQTFINLPHPSGIAVSPDRKSVFVVSTRNPNKIIEFKAIRGLKERNDLKLTQNKNINYLMPIREKYFPGHYYFHDLAFIGKELYANSVGQNGVVKIDMTSNYLDKVVWWPKSVEDKNSILDSRANYIQLNSIAAGKSIQESFFSASSTVKEKNRPGDVSYKVDKRGVIFSGKTREVFAKGLTRPHSARIYQGKLWVANSGYGEVGFIEKGKFNPVLKLPGWTRGLHFTQKSLFVGVSRIIPKFESYAPGVSKRDNCGVFAFDAKTLIPKGSIIWPSGNQIFSIESIKREISDGFIFTDLKKTNSLQKGIFYCYNL